jgi:LysM repeat protein
MKKLFISLFVTLASLSLYAQSMNQFYLNYIQQYSGLAITEMKAYGIPASITLAQGLLESGAGKSRLATEANNHFGIKCRSDWKGERIYHDDDALGECFRKYKSAKDSYEDHSLFLVSGKRYESLFSLGSTNYKEWATGLQNAGYATDKNYAQRLIKIIEDYELYLYDNPKYAGESQAKAGKEAQNISTKPKDKKRKNPKKATDGSTITEREEPRQYIGAINPYFVHSVKKNNGVTYAEAAYGDTYGSIAEEFGLLESEILQLNDIDNPNKLKEGDKVYLTRKKAKADKGLLVHKVKEGETLLQIAQRYGVRMASLQKMNKLEQNASLRTDQLLRLR